VRRLREWADVRHQLWGLIREKRDGREPAKAHLPGTWPLEAVHRAVLTGMLGNVLARDAQKHAYKGTAGREVHIHPGSALRSGKSDDGKRAPPPPPWLLSCDIMETTRVFARLCAPIDPEWVIATLGDRCRLS